MRAVLPVSSLCPFIHPSSRLTNTGAEFHQWPLLKHLHYGVLLLLLCQTKPPCQWNKPTGQQPPPGSCGAAGPHQNSQPDSPGLDLIAGQETNLCVCWQQLRVQCPHSLIYPTNRLFSCLVADQICHQGWT